MLAETSRSYEGPADIEDRFEKLLDKWRDSRDEPELAEINDLRIAFQLGIEYAKHTL